jgi:methyl-accepting chemotaxis protein
MFTTIRSKLLAMGAVTLLLVALIVAASTYSIRLLSADLSVSSKNLTIVRHHLLTDMFHDGTVGGVRGVLLAAQTGDPAKVAESRAELKDILDNLAREHALTKDALEANRADTDDATRAAFAEVQKQVAQYIIAANAIGVQATENYAAADAAMPAFLKAFNDLQDAQLVMTDLVDTHTQELDAIAEKESQQSIYLTVGLGLLALLVTSLVLYLVVGNISHSLGALLKALTKWGEGDDTARANLKTKDELGQLSNAFDGMLMERLAAARKENDQLNESVLSLLQGVAGLANKDLTSKVPVAEDVTGAVADALNLMSSQTAKVLQSVSDISADVTTASLKVQEQSNRVSSVAENEQREVVQTSRSLAEAAHSMTQIADLAKVCSTAADNAIKTTQTALDSVTNTVGGINATRETIRETEKRIKRLGERSQEISGVVGLINTIAERTHILALNASMHAASAGEAGRGFAVVADEVQRLAENARQATAQIATMVQNIQVETADTVTTMNTAIAQVVEGSKLAEVAGTQMQLTQTRTAELVGYVQQIATSSQAQAKSSSDLLLRAQGITDSAEQTRKELKDQNEQTTSLVEYARRLLEAVRVFKLPV